jgi:hypothetical protein
MGRGRARSKQSKVNREVKYPGTRRAQRESVDAEVRRFLDGGEDGEGSAGVREPRNPKPKPLSSAGERPMPQQQFALSLPDPRY